MPIYNCSQAFILSRPADVTTLPTNATSSGWMCSSFALSALQCAVSVRMPGLLVLRGAREESHTNGDISPLNSSLYKGQAAWRNDNMSLNMYYFKNAFLVVFQTEFLI